MSTHRIPLSLPALDRINRHAYGNAGVLRQFGGASGWLEPGERQAMEFVAAAVCNAPILDIGIGGGRTAPLMRRISPDYRGIDYTPAMVRLAQQRFPDCMFMEMDARDLAFANDTFGLVAFSYNGIDSIDLAGRLQVLREAYRVLQPGGYFVFSALNRRGASSAGHWPDWTVFHDAGCSPMRLLRGCARLALGGINRLRRSRILRDGTDVAVGQIAAHNFALVTLFISAGEQVRELLQAGFSVAAIFQPDGTQIKADGSHDGAAPWYHYVARKPDAADA